jgi:hypothetical protein
VTRALLAGEFYLTLVISPAGHTSSATCFPERWAKRLYRCPDHPGVMLLVRGLPPWMWGTLTAGVRTHRGRSSPRRWNNRVDAAFAAMAEYLARRDGWEVPSWARLPGREAWPWWFVTDLRGLHPRALVESSPSFRRRGVFITSGALDRA